MRQTLFHIPSTIFGLPLFGFGILFWLILIAGIVPTLRNLARRRGTDALFYAAVTCVGLFLAGAVGPNISEASGFPIRGYGFFLTLAIVVSTALTVRRGRVKWNYPSDMIFATVFVAAFFGIAGARAFYVTQYWEEYRSESLRRTIIDVLNITNGGLVVYGSIIGGILAMIVFLRAKRIPVLATLDLFMPALMLGIAIGRLGCFMNGCCFGGVCDKPWAVTFPAGSPAHVLQLEEGKISLYGMTLKAQSPPWEAEEADEHKDVFSFKSHHLNLMTEFPSPVEIASVDPGSAAEEAGVRAGDRILEIGVAPQELASRINGGQDKLAGKAIRRFRPENNAQVFYFFLNMWPHEQKEHNALWLVVRDPATETTESETPPSPRTLVFTPEESKSLPVHPTQLYSSLSALAVCIVLLIIAGLDKKIPALNRDGVVLALGLVFYALARFGLELLRTDEDSFCGTGLTVSQCVSLGVGTIGIALLIQRFCASPRRALDGFFPTEAGEPEEAAKTE